MTVSIIIPNYNGKKLLEKNLPKVIKEIEKLRNLVIEVIVVDDCSSDNSVRWLNNYASRFKKTELKIKIIENEKNLGFSSTVNRGVKAVNGEIVVLLNTDVYPERGFLEPILPHFQDPKVFAVGMMDKSIEDGKIVRRGRGIGKWQRGFYVHRRGEIDKSDTDWVSGGSGAFRKLIFLKLGGFDPIYNPFYWEDIDLSYKAVKAGYKILFERKSIVIHEHEKGAISKKYGQNEIKTIAYRNQFLFVWKNADFKQWLLHLFWLPYHFLKALLNRDFLFILGFFKAFVRILKTQFLLILG